MPDPVTHHVFGREVIASLPEEIRSRIDLPVFDRSVHGPDPWSAIGFFGGKYKQYAVRSNLMHKSHTGLFLTELAKASKEDMSVPTFSVLAGMICHYCLDRLAHPYIICKGGEYDGTEETRAQCGGHVRLERGIDSFFIRRTYGKVPWRFPIARRILGLRKLPQTLQPVLNGVYGRVYGWDDAFTLFNVSLRYEKMFYTLMQDPLGIVHMLLRPISGGKTNYCIYSFYHREIDRDKLDYLNEKHASWHHPFDASIVSSASFLDLYEQAKQDAIRMLQTVYRWIVSDDGIILETVFGNVNYSTGLDCDDHRNFRPPLCEPLVFDRKY